MARIVKKSVTGKTSGPRGAPIKKSTATPKKRGRQPASQQSVVRAQRPVTRKRGRPPGSGRANRTASAADPTITAQLEAIHGELKSLAGLRSDIQDLHVSMEVLSGAIDALLKNNRTAKSGASTEERGELPRQHIEVDIPETEDSI